MTSRGFESIYRIAEAFARLMLKNVIDAEVVDQTIKFVSDMYRKYGAEIVESPDHFTYVYLAIAKEIKEHSQNLLWAQSQGAINSEELDDITFNEALERASKNPKVSQYVGNDFRSSHNRVVRRLREIFREEREFEGGKIIDVSKDKHSEHKLRWVPDANAGTEQK